jgi:hypothetical protein
MSSVREACQPPSRRLCSWALCYTAALRAALCGASAAPQVPATAAQPSGPPQRTSFRAAALRGTTALTGLTTAPQRAAGVIAHWTSVSAARAPPRRLSQGLLAARLTAASSHRMPLVRPPLTSCTPRSQLRAPPWASTTTGLSSHRRRAAPPGSRARLLPTGGGAAPAADACVGGPRSLASTLRCPTTHLSAASAAVLRASVRALPARSGTAESFLTTPTGGLPAPAGTGTHRCAS